MEVGHYEVVHDFGKGFYTLGSLEEKFTITQRTNGAHLEVCFSPPPSSNVPVHELMCYLT